MGPWPRRELKTQAFHIGTRSRIVHSVPYCTESESTRVFYIEAPHQNETGTMRTIASPPVGIDDPYYSSASLDNVSFIHLYRDVATKRLRGLILKYDNGAQRALGSCRFGVDRPETFQVLHQLHFRCHQDPYFVEMEAMGDSQTSNGEWTQLASGHRLEVWFNHTEMHMALYPF